MSSISNLKIVFSGAILAMSLAGCLDDNGTSSATNPTTTVSGVAMAGPFLSGAVCAYQVANGNQGENLGECSNINPADSTFSITFSGYNGDVLLAVENNATYNDEAAGNTLLNGTMRSLITVSEGGTITVAVTPLTEAAIQKAGSLSHDAVVAAGNGIRDLFAPGTQLNLFTTLPNLTVTSNQEQVYHEALRALSHLQNTAGKSYQEYITLFVNNPPSATELGMVINAHISPGCTYTNNVINCIVNGGGSMSGGTACVANISAVVSGITSGAYEVCYKNLPSSFSCDQIGAGAYAAQYANELGLANVSFTYTFSSIDSCDGQGALMNIDLGGSGSGGGDSTGGGVNGPKVDLTQLASICTSTPTLLDTVTQVTQYSGCNGTKINPNNISVFNTINSWLLAHGSGITVYNSNYTGITIGDACSFMLEPGLGLWMLTVKNKSIPLTPDNFDGTVASIIEVNAAGEVLRMAVGDFMSSTGGREVSFLGNNKLDIVSQSTSNNSDTITLFCGN